MGGLKQQAYRYLYEKKSNGWNVDSSVVALLLKQQGFDVTGVTLMLKSNKYGFLNSQDTDIEDAKKVAQKIGISHTVVDFSELFEEKVIKNFVSEYCKGRTPNPCIDCNKFLKFGAMFDYAMSKNFDYIATGHYAITDFDSSKNRWLLKCVDNTKDQSYVLYNLTQEQLARVIFPLGNLKKAQIRKIAEDFKLPVAHKTDSQEICFIKNQNYVQFIKDYFNFTGSKGNFKDKDGNILGQHSGILNYTIGQRKGLGVSFGKPMYVIGLDATQNEVILGQENEQYSKELIAKNLNFILFDKLTDEIKVTAKIRYQAEPQLAVIVPISECEVKVIFESAQRAVTPGQSIVFYDGDIVIGGGIIA